MAFLKAQNDRGVLVIHFSMPRIVDQDVINDVGRELDALVKSVENGAVLINFGNVKFMSSAMLGKLIVFNKSCKKNEVTLKLSNIGKEIYEVFKITSMDKLFKIYADQAAAMKGFEEEGRLL